MGDTGKVIGELIGLGIGVAIAKKLIDDITQEPKKKKQKKIEIAKDWVSNEVGVWN